MTVKRKNMDNQVVEEIPGPTAPQTWTATERDPDTGEMKKPSEEASNEHSE